MAEDDLRERLFHQLARMGLAVPAETCGRLVWFLGELLRWNRRINLTAITDPAEGIEKHLVDSLIPLPLLRGDETVLDIGSGGGFPGIPLKIASPGLKIRSIDAVRKKVDFQRHVVRRLALKGFEPVHGRIEEWAENGGWNGAFGVVISRAFASLVDFGRGSLPFLAPGGRILAMKGPGGGKELAERLADLTQAGLVCTDIRYVTLPVSGAVRTLISLQRIGER